MWIVILIVALVPPILLAAIALQRAPSVSQFSLTTLALALGLLFCWVMLPWDAVSIYYRWLVALLFLLALYRGFTRIRTAAREMPRWQRWVNTNINLGLIVFFAVLSWAGLKGYPAPSDVVELSSPLSGGKFVVRQGGGSPFINIHAKVQPQNYALDILGLNSWGASAGLPDKENSLARYAIFGAEIISPCDGQVVVALDGLDDLDPGKTDKENLAGNHVVIACQGVEIVLAHMQNDSVQVTRGDRVRTGELLGRVGNSGNTSEPHLHIHAERGGEPGHILDGEAAAFTINGRYLVRGDIIR
jgi:hypothetical protein